MSLVAKKRKSDAFHDKSLNDYIVSEAESRGIPVMDEDGNIPNMVGALRSFLNNAGFKGAEADDQVQDIFFQLYVEPGLVWDSYENHLAEGKSLPLHKFSNTAFKSKVMNAIRDRQTKERQQGGPSVSLSPSEDEGSDFQLADPMSVSYEDAEWTEQVMKGIRDYISSSRNSENFLPIWDMMMRGFSRDEMIEALNQDESTPPVTYGIVNNRLHRVKDMAAEYVKSVTPELRAKSASVWTNPKNKQSINVTLVQSGRKSSKIQLPDGTAFVIPNEQLS
jgi:hypothetical protein